MEREKRRKRKRTVTKGDIYQDPADKEDRDIIQNEIRFHGDTAEGKRVCFSNKVSLTFQVLPESEIKIPELSSRIQVKQAIVSEPAENEGYQPEEAIQYAVSITNKGAQIIAGMLMKGIESEEPLCITNLRPGETRIITCEYRVTVQDAVNGYVCWRQSLWEEGEETEKPRTVRSNMLIVPVTAK